MKNKEIQKKLEEEYNEHEIYINSLNENAAADFFPPAQFFIAAGAILFFVYIMRH